MAATTSMAAATTTTAAMAPSSSGMLPPPDINTLPALAWIVFAVFVVLVVAFCFTVARYYTDRHETECFPFTVTVAALSTTCLALFLIPIDVYLAPHYAAAPANGDAVEYAYYVLYAVLLVFAMFVVPFAYFYYEEEDADTTARQRAWAGCKYSSFLVVILLVLFVIGAFLNNAKAADYSMLPDDVRDGLARVLTKQPVRFSVGFAVAAMTLLGYVCWLTYAAYGLSAFPLGLMRGRRRRAEEQTDLLADISVTREKKRAITSKYLSGKKMKRRDEKALDALRRQERVLSRQHERLAGESRGVHRALLVLRPFSFVFGVVFALLSLLFFFSLLLTQIDVEMHSCGAACAFFLASPFAYNPLDAILRNTAPFFPLDLVIFTVVIVYVFLATLAAITKVGIRLLWIELFRIRRRASPPQALLLMSVVLMLSLLTLSVHLLAMAPSYATFGGQTIDGVRQCTVQHEHCQMTKLATLLQSVKLNMPFFAVVFHYGTWLFLAICLVMLVVAIVVRRRAASNVDEHDSDSEERL